MPGMAFLTKLRELLQPKVSADDWAVAVKTARGHAGGTGKAAARKTYDDWLMPAPYLSGPSDVPDLADDCPCPDDLTVLFEKADARVTYRPATVVGHACQDCQNFCEDHAACRLVEGTINELAVCDLWQAETEDEPGQGPMGARELADVCASGGQWRLFNEMQEYAEPPVWAPVLPKPGTYQHSQYGAISITSARNQQFMANFAGQVYQKHIPVDAEHETKLSGALGYLEELRQNADGSVDGRIDWSARGAELVRNDAYRYVSPEWFDRWTDPATQQSYDDVLIGLALTTRPFFKDGSLRPLVATERGIFAPDPRPNAPGTVVFMALPATEVTKVAEPQASTTEPQQFAELQARAAALEAELAASKQASEANAAQALQLAERVATMEKDARRKRFTDEVMGKSDASGVRWFGEVGQHVALMETLADACGGEDSEQFQAYVTQQRATAEQLRTAGLFREIGSDASGSGGSTAWERVQAAAKTFMETHSVSEAVAIDHVISTDAKLASEYAAETRVGGR